MKKTITMLAAGLMACSTLVAQSVEVESEVIGGKTYVSVKNLKDIDPGKKYTYTVPDGYKLRTVWVSETKDADGTVTSRDMHHGYDLVGTNNTLDYYDLARLRNGYKIEIAKKNEGSSSEGMAKAPYTIEKKTVHWADGNKGRGVILNKPEVGYHVGDYIQVWMSSSMWGDSERKGQLMIYNGDNSYKYGWTDKEGVTINYSDQDACKWNSNESHRSDFQTVHYNHDTNCFSFKIDESLLTLLNDTNTQLEFDGDGIEVESAELLYTPAVDPGTGDDDPISFTLTKTDENTFEIIGTEVTSGGSSSGSTDYGKDGDKYFYNKWWENKGTTWMGDNWDDNTTTIEVPFHNFSAGDNIYIDYKDANYGPQATMEFMADASTNSGEGYSKHMFTSDKDYYDLSDGTGKVTVTLTQKEANILNNNANSVIRVNGKKFNFLSLSYKGANEWKPAATDPADAQEKTYKFYNLWNAKDDDLTNDWGFGAENWGFSKSKGGKDALNAFNSYFGEGSGRDNHDLAQVQEYFDARSSEAERANWADPNKQVNPSLWTATVTPFAPEAGDQLILAVDLEGDPNAESQDDRNTMQLWYIDDIGKTVFYDKWGSGTDLNLNTYGGTKADLHYIVMNLSSETAKLAKNGLRFKGANYRIHSIDWVHATPNQRVLTENVSHIHVAPQALRSHAHYGFASGEWDSFRPSYGPNDFHYAGEYDNEGNLKGKGEKNRAHTFTENIYFNMVEKLPENTTLKEVMIYTYAPDGVPCYFPMLVNGVLTDRTNEHKTVSSEELNNIPEWTDYTPKDLSSLGGTNFYYTLKTAAENQEYVCDCDVCVLHHGVTTSRLWYMPLRDLFKAIDANGLYFRITTEHASEAQGGNTQTSAPAHSPLKAAAGTKDPLTGLTFAPLTGDLADQYVTYALTDNVTTPPVYYQQIAINNDTSMPTGVVQVEDKNAPVVFYTIDGLRVSEKALTPGLYIRKQGKNVTKILVK